MLRSPSSPPPAASKPEADWGPKPEPSADFKAKLAAMTAATKRGDEREASRLLAEATQLYEQWATSEIRARYDAGMTQASTPTKEPPPQIREIIHIDRIGAPLGVGGNSMDRVRAILYRWAETRLRVVRTEGIALATRGGAATPPQVAEAIGIARNVQTIASGDIPAAANDGTAIAREIFSSWATTRLPQLRDAGLAIAAEGRPAAPEQIADVLRIRREAEQLPGDTPSLAPIADRAIALVKEIVAKWVDTRADRLVAAGRPAADAGGPATPPQVDQLLALAREMECVDQALDAGAAERVRDRARTLAERHLAAHRAKLTCPIATPPRAGFARLVSGLTSRGWGPYEQLPSCSWKGTITIAQVKSRNAVTRGSCHGACGNPFTVEHDERDSTLIVVEVADGRGAATVSGVGQMRKVSKYAEPPCSYHGQVVQERRTSTYSGSGTVAVEVTQVGGDDYLISVNTPMYRRVDALETEWNGVGSCPLTRAAGKTSSTETDETAAGMTPIRDTAIRLASLTGPAPLGLELEGTQTIAMPISRSGEERWDVRISWKLVRD